MLGLELEHGTGSDDLTAGWFDLLQPPLLFTLVLRYSYFYIDTTIESFYL